MIQTEKNHKKQRRIRGKNAWRKGIIGEYVALLFLIIKGYIPLKRRYKSPVGEIDIIARKRHQIIFVEVKTRPKHEDAIEALTYHQIKRLRRTAHYWQSHNTHRNITLYRFDLICISNRYIPKHIQNILG